jgi:outer membrane receptor protein involved in Fe transport
VTAENAGALGAQPTLLPTQQAAGMDINTDEINEFGTLSWRHQIDPRTSLLLGATLLHSGQSVTNNNPPVDQLNLPVDSSIEYNPDVSRNAHHQQLAGSITSRQGAHQLKAGFLLDGRSGHESYRIGSASRLALDELAALDPTLAPAGAVQTDVHGNAVLDVNGNPVYLPTNGVVPRITVARTGHYDAAYLQDTWRVSKRLTVNYGLRWDSYFEKDSAGGTDVSSSLVSPRLNFSYGLDKRSTLRWSYNKLFNTPPLAQGSIVGAPIQPEILDQYDASIEHDFGHGQSAKLAYYAKQAKNQVDTGLLIPGVPIGVYSAVNFDRGGIHGIEFSYDISAPKGIGWDGFLNYSHSKAAPNGFDSRGQPAPEYNDHDQRESLGLGLAYTWRSKASIAGTFNYGSGLASSIVHNNRRTPRSQLDLRFATGPKFFWGRGSLGLEVENVFDTRTVINFQSAFSGTRFQRARRVLLSASFGF